MTRTTWSRDFVELRLFFDKGSPVAFLTSRVRIESSDLEALKGRRVTRLLKGARTQGYKVRRGTNHIPLWFPLPPVSRSCYLGAHANGPVVQGGVDKVNQ